MPRYNYTCLCGKHHTNVYRNPKQKPPTKCKNCNTVPTSINKLTEERKEFIIKAYSETRINLSKEITKLLKMPCFQGIKRKTISYWATTIGIAKSIERRPWSNSKENELLERLIGERSVCQIHKIFQKAGFQRSLNAISKRIFSLGYSSRHDSFTMTEIARIMRCCDKTVKRWIQKGVLINKKTEGFSEISPANLANFIWNYPEELEDVKPDFAFVIALLKEQVLRLNNKEKK